MLGRILVNTLAPKQWLRANIKRHRYGAANFQTKKPRFLSCLHERGLFLVGGISEFLYYPWHRFLYIIRSWYRCTILKWFWFFVATFCVLYRSGISGWCSRRRHYQTNISAACLILSDMIFLEVNSYSWELQERFAWLQREINLEKIAHGRKWMAMY